MNIWLIQTGEIIPQSTGDRYMRTAQLGKELAASGHHVTWWASAFEHQRKRWIDKTEINLAENYKIILLKGIGYKKNISINRFIDHLIVARKFKKQAPKLIKPDIIIYSLPEHNLAYKAQKFAEKYKIPTFVDLRDYWPDYMLNFFDNQLIKKTLKFILFRDFYRSRYALKNADVLISMMQSMFKWGLEKGKRKPNPYDRVFYIGSNPPPQIINNKKNEDIENEKIIDLNNQLTGKFNIIFAGSFTKINNPENIIKLAEYINSNRYLKDKVNFILAGYGELYKSTEKLTKNIKNIYLTGWISESELATLMKISSLGIIPVISNEDFFPNKAFLYFSGKLPVLSSAKGELSQLIEQNKLGYNINFNDIPDIVEKINTLIEQPEILKQMKANTFKIFSKKFDSKIIYKNYTNLIEQFMIDYKKNK